MQYNTKIKLKVKLMKFFP